MALRCFYTHAFSFQPPRLANSASSELLFKLKAMNTPKQEPNFLERYAMVLERCSFVPATSAWRTLRIVQRHG